MATIEARTEKLEKSVSEIERKSNRLENFKAFATILSSLIIAGAGIWVTESYNSKQLEITKRQSDAQITIARDKEVVDLIAKLGSNDPRVRRISAASLSLPEYRKDAIPPLIATLGDNDSDVDDSIVKALLTIGKDSAADLLKVFEDKRSDDDVKGDAIIILAKLDLDQSSKAKVFQLALAALRTSLADFFLRESAASALGNLKDKRAVDPLLTMLKDIKGSDTLLPANIIWALGEIGDRTAEPAVESLLADRNPYTRTHAIWALAKLKDKDQVIKVLSEIQKTDNAEEVRKAAADCIFILQNGIPVEQAEPEAKTKPEAKPEAKAKTK